MSTTRTVIISKPKLVTNEILELSLDQILTKCKSYNIRLMQQTAEKDYGIKPYTIGKKNNKINKSKERLLTEMKQKYDMRK